ncbi:PREDICTED: perilipin-3 [Corvus brachyrhynchos]|nr:PREDICTED: perilipin-3 [Corvus brachyrhynchos]
MATSEPTPAQPKAEEQQSIGTRVANLPLVSSAYDMVSSAYTCTKESHPYVRSVCDAAEKGVKTLTAAAVSGAQPLLTRLEPQISTANEFACKGLDKLEEKLPILQQPPEKLISDTKLLVTSTVTGAKDALTNTVAGAKDAVTSTVAGAKDAVTSRVTGVMDMTKGAVQGGMELTRSAVSSGVSTVMGSSVGQMVASGVGSVLGKSEELVDHYLPMTDEELAKLATAVEGFEPEQQRQQQSYFVRLGSLSTKLQHRALQHSLGKLQSARQSSQDLLAQLQRTLDLVEHLRQGMDQRLQGGQEKLQQLWLEWSKKQPGGGKDQAPPETVESGTLTMLQGLTQQLQSSCQPLVSSLQGLPASIQDTAGGRAGGARGLQHPPDVAGGTLLPLGPAPGGDRVAILGCFPSKTASLGAFANPPSPPNLVPASVGTLLPAPAPSLVPLLGTCSDVPWLPQVPLGGPP